jgi:hypothetical protein
MGLDGETGRNRTWQRLTNHQSLITISVFNYETVILMEALFLVKMF